LPRGDLLLTLEAMKMQTAVRAESDGEVAEVLARPGQAVDAKDLLMVLPLKQNRVTACRGARFPHRRACRAWGARARR